MRAAKKKAEAEIQSIVNNTEGESKELSKVQVGFYIILWGSLHVCMFVKAMLV